MAFFSSNPRGQLGVAGFGQVALGLQDLEVGRQAGLEALGLAVELLLLELAGDDGRCRAAPADFDGSGWR